MSSAGPSERLHRLQRHGDQARAAFPHRDPLLPRERRGAFRERERSDDPGSLGPRSLRFSSLEQLPSQAHGSRPERCPAGSGDGKWTRLTGGNLTTGSGANASYLVGPSDFAQIYGVNQVWQQNLGTPSSPKNLVGTGQTIGSPSRYRPCQRRHRDPSAMSLAFPRSDRTARFLSTILRRVCLPCRTTFAEHEGYLDAGGLARWPGRGHRFRRVRR